MRPWETLSPSPWEAQQPIYNRTVAVHRLKTVAGGTPSIGITGYSGAEQSTAANNPEGESVLFTNLPASIQGRTIGRTKGTLLPGDIVYKPNWVIDIPSSAIAQYTIRDRDIIIDDEGYRYGVAMNRWSVFGYKLDCIRLET